MNRLELIERKAGVTIHRQTFERSHYKRLYRVRAIGRGTYYTVTLRAARTLAASFRRTA